MNTKIPKRVLEHLAKEVCGKITLSDLTDADKHAMAIRLYERGYIHQCSSFDDAPTYGYGKMDDWGFFEYQLYEKDLGPGLNKRRIMEKQSV
jgi:hypothetical protein